MGNATRQHASYAGCVMGLLIDGYNLLYKTNIMGPAPRAHSRAGQPVASGLQRSREALLRFLAASIDETDLPRTTIVFDAAGAPPGLPRQVDYHGMMVRYAAEYADADTLIEELIQTEAAPRALLVVSSDHRIQRAARRRRASFMDSDRWFGELCRRRHARQQHRRPLPDKPVGPLSDAEVAYWVRQFMSETEFIANDETAEKVAEDTTAIPGDDDGANPFPPGYGEDLLGGQ